jgi:signal peptidase I
MQFRHLIQRVSAVSRAQRGFVGEWVVTAILLLFGTSTLLQAFVIPSGSMESSLLIGDHVFVDKMVYGPSDSVTKHLLPYREVRRGDVIVFPYPLDRRIDYVKRAIGVPGDRIHFVNKQLILNGHAVREPYAIHIDAGHDDYRDNFPAYPPHTLRPRAARMIADHVANGELVVPPGYLFAMGDNRENSDDSRYWGLVPMDSVEGTPVLIYWSFDAPTEDLVNPNIGFDHIADVVTHFFTKTRWSRMFKLVRGYNLQ